MDNQISRAARHPLILLTLIILCISGCKENKWIDWKTQNEIWLKNNESQPGVETSTTGLQYKIKADPGAANGEAKPNSNSTVICDYTLKLINGCVIDSRKGKPFILSSTIPGFAEGCHKIHCHGDIELYIPAYLGYDYEKYESNKYGSAEGYGTEGTTGYIPPYSTLIFTVHICAVSGN